MASVGVVNGLSFDVEDYFQVSAFDNIVAREQWATTPRRVVANTMRLLDRVDEAGIRATFFVLGWIAERERRLVAEISRRGHEVASHGWSHQLIYRQTPAQFAAEARDSKALLEEITGQAVDGYRAASYSITRRSLWALEILAELGFRYDSSIYPVHHDRYGIPDAPRSPHVRTLANGRSITEIPIATLRLLGQNVPVGGGGYFRLLPYRVTRAALRRINREGMPFVFYLHPWEVDPGQPKIAVTLPTRFRHYLNLGRCEARLQRLLADFRFAPLRDVLLAQEFIESSAPMTVAR